MNKKQLTQTQLFETLSEIVLKSFNADFMETFSDENVSSEDFEKVLMNSLMGVGRKILQKRFDEFSHQDNAPYVVDNGEILPRQQRRKRNYVSVFGTVEIERSYYWKKGNAGIFPLDGRLKLPKRCYSYHLQECLAHLVSYCTYDEAQGLMERLLGVRIAERPILDCITDIAEHADLFRKSQPPPELQGEKEILVLSIDGKGVTMRKDELVGHKYQGKIMSTVGVVYATDLNIRNADDILQRSGQDGKKEKQVKPYGKRVYARLSDREGVFKFMKWEAGKRSVRDFRHKVFIADGERAIWLSKMRHFPQWTGILDIYHVMEYVWKCAHCFYGKQSEKANRYFEEKMRLILSGRLADCFEILTKESAGEVLNKDQVAVICGARDYFDSHSSLMEYDIYLKKGFPIGSGCVESVCKNLIRQRMEGSGMRWSSKGAQSIMSIRAICLNGDLSDFFSLYKNKQRKQLYEKAA